MQQPIELAGPTQPAERIVALDVWRGFAVLGILIMNIQSFAMPSDAYFVPTLGGSLEGAEFYAWLGPYLLADGKFITMFSMLFGVGILLITDRREALGEPWAPLHYRRMFVLLAIGLVHAYGIWYGDILVPYAVTGMIVVHARSFSAGALLGGGLAMLVILTGLLLLSAVAYAFGSMPAEAMPWGFDAAEAEVSVYRGGWGDQMAHRVPMSLEMHTFGFAFFLFWFVGGMMLIGMSLYRWGVLRGAARTRVYVTLLIVGLAIGLPLTALNAAWRVSSDWAADVDFAAMAIDLWADLLVALAWFSGLMLIMRAGVWRTVQRWLANVGRLALSNYLLQSVICTTIFYGHGFGLFGSVSRVQQLGVVVLVWIVLIVFSNAWLKRHDFGPMEWLWRRLTYSVAPGDGNARRDD